MEDGKDVPLINTVAVVCYLCHTAGFSKFKCAIDGPRTVLLGVFTKRKRKDPHLFVGIPMKIYYVLISSLF